MAARKKVKAKTAKTKQQRSRKSTKSLYISRMPDSAYADYEVFSDKDEALDNSAKDGTWRNADFSMCSGDFERATGIKFPKGQTRLLTITVGPPLKQPKRKPEPESECDEGGIFW